VMEWKARGCGIIKRECRALINFNRRFLF